MKSALYLCIHFYVIIFLYLFFERFLSVVYIFVSVYRTSKTTHVRKHPFYDIMLYNISKRFLENAVVLSVTVFTRCYKNLLEYH